MEKVTPFCRKKKETCVAVFFLLKMNHYLQKLKSLCIIAPSELLSRLIVSPSTDKCFIWTYD